MATKNNRREAQLLAFLNPIIVDRVRYTAHFEDTSSGLARYRVKLADSGVQLSGGIDGMPHDNFAVSGANAHEKHIMQEIGSELQRRGLL